VEEPTATVSSLLLKLYLLFAHFQQRVSWCLSSCPNNFKCCSSSSLFYRLFLTFLCSTQLNVLVSCINNNYSFVLDFVFILLIPKHFSLDKSIIRRFLWKRLRGYCSLVSFINFQNWHLY